MRKLYYQIPMPIKRLAFSLIPYRYIVGKAYQDTLKLCKYLPIVSTPAGAIPDMLPTGKNDFLTDPGDVESLSKLLAARLADRAKLEQWSMALQEQFADKSTAGKVFERQKNIYNVL